MATENGSQATMEDNIKKLFDAMDIIAAQQVKNLQFDKTVKCSITDDSKSEQGEYTVTDGSSTFKAYSESTKYSNGASVYVNIPNGDYNNKKIITGRYDKDRADYNTNDPEKSYIDITQNLISNSTGETGITANGEKTQITIWDSGDNFSKKLEEEKDDTKKDEGIKYKAYKKMLIKAKFKNYLSQKNVILGNYGIRVDILGEKKNTAEQTVEDWYMFKLDSSSMIGDPYKFEVSFEQKLLFDLDPDVNITRVRVVLYQDKNFYDKSKNLLTPSNFDDIFVSEPFVSFGYSLEDFTEDTVLLYTFDSKKYAEHLTEETKQTLAKQSEIEHQKDSTKKAFTVEDLDKTELYTEQLNKLNKKKIILRWVHETTGEDEKTRSFESVAQVENIPTGAIIHWYKYDLTQGVTDKIAGAFWVEMVEQKNKFELEYSPNPKKSFEMFRVIIEYMSREYVNNYLIANDEDILEIENKKEDERTDEEKEQLDNLKNSYLEKINDYISEDLKFENENMVPDENTIDLIKGLTIACDNSEGGYNGVYRIYNDNGTIMSSSEADKMRLLTAQYTSIVSGVSELDTAEKIVWSIPLENTMIYSPKENSEYSFYDKIEGLTQEQFSQKKDNYFTFSQETETYTKAISWDERETYYQKNRTQVEVKNGYFEITRYGVKPDATAGTEEADSTQQYFRIKDYYTQSAVNNTVYCTIIKNNRTYTASFDMVFGPCGTNGTDYTFTLEFGNKEPAITCTDDTITVVPKIYDYQNKDVTEKYAKNIFYFWYSENEEYKNAHPIKDSSGKVTGSQSAIEIQSVDKSTGIVTLKLNSHDLKDLNYFILQGQALNVVNIKNLKNYKTEDSADKNVDGKVETDALTENVGSNTNKKGIDVSLYTYLPIPVRRTEEYTTFDGATKVVYNTAGVDPQYYKDPYVIYEYKDKKTQAVPDMHWMISLGKDTQTADTGTTNLKYYPTLDSDNKLVVPSMYLQNNGKAISVIGFTFGSGGLQYEWIQPLYIFQNSFASSLLNSWDGSLTFDEENGTILSTMMGAGKKDSQNRFNGVLMGDLSPAFNTDEGVSLLKDYYSGIGLYGFNEGQKSFGLNINGRAFFGKSGHGQILIDGNTGTIQSQKYLASMSGYNNGSVATEDDIDDTMREGMCIDLDAGTFITYGTGTNAMIKIDPTPQQYGAYFEIRSSKNKTVTDEDGNESIQPGEDLIFIGDDRYFLQSHNYTDLETQVPKLDADGNIVYTDAKKTQMEYVTTSYGTGINFDLNNGKLTAFDFEMMAKNSKTGAFISINSNGSPYLDIYAVGKDANKKTISNHVITVSDSFQYLRSLDYDSDKETGTEFNLGSGRINSYDFGLRAVKNNKGIEINSDGHPFLRISSEYKNEQKYLLNIEEGYPIKDNPNKDTSEFYMQSKDFHEKTSKDNGAGMYFDLKEGKITAYSFTIEAYKLLDVIINGKKDQKWYTLTIDSTRDHYPLQVGALFRVDWDGQIEASGGKIGPFTIGSKVVNGEEKFFLYTDSANFGGSGVYLGSDGISVGNGSFKADDDGNIYLTGIITGTNWSVTKEGQANFSNIHATGGTIAGWTIGDGVLSNDGTELSSDGLKFSGGELTTSHLQFGNVTLSSEGLKASDNVSLTSEGLQAGSVKLNSSGLDINGAGLNAGNNGYLSTTGTLWVSSNLYVENGGITAKNLGATGTVSLPIGTKFGGKTLGALAFKDSVSKKIKVTMSKGYSVPAGSKTVFAHWVDSSNPAKGVTLNESGAGAIASYPVSAGGGGGTTVIEHTFNTVLIGATDNETITLSYSG